MHSPVLRVGGETQFPSARFVVCNRHLHENVTHKLDVVTGSHDVIEVAEQVLR